MPRAFDVKTPAPLHDPTRTDLNWNVGKNKIDLAEITQIYWEGMFTTIGEWFEDRTGINILDGFDEFLASLFASLSNQAAQAQMNIQQFLTSVKDHFTEMIEQAQARSDEIRATWKYLWDAVFDGNGLGLGQLDFRDAANALVSKATVAHTNALTGLAALLVVKQIESGRLRAGANLIPDPYFENSDMLYGSAFISSEQSYAGGGKSVKLVSDHNAYQVYGLFRDETTGANAVHVLPGDVFYIEFMLRGKSTNTQNNPAVVGRFEIQSINSAGTVIGWHRITFNPSTTYNGVWTQFKGYLTLPLFATSMTAWLVLDPGFNAGETYYFDNVVLKEYTHTQTVIDKIIQAITGASGTGNFIHDIVTSLQQAWAHFWDGLTGGSGTSSKLPTDVKVAAAAVKSTADNGVANAATAQASTQFVVDAIHQAVNGGSAIGNLLASVFSNLQKAWAAFWDGLTGNSGTTAKLPSDVKTAAAAVNSTASTALTNAATADGKAVTAQSAAATADSKAVTAQSAAATADSKAVTADGKAVAAQGTANTAFTNAATADGKAVVADGKAVTAQSAAATADGKAVAAQGTANTAVTNASTADGKAVAAQGTANTAVTNAATADGKAVAAQSTANTAVTNAATADGKAVIADGKAVTADGKAVTADGKAVTADGKAVAAQGTANTAFTNAATADGKAVVADGKAVTADGKAVTADGKAVAAQSTANTAVTNAATADGKAVAAQNSNATTNTAIYNGYYGSGGTGTSSQVQSTVEAIKLKLTSGYTLQTVTATGTWTRPWTPGSVDEPREFWAVCIGSGGGGGAGYYTTSASLTSMYGGQGGKGGGYAAIQINPSDITSTVACTVATGAAGATSANYSSSAGGPPTSGGETSFGSYIATLAERAFVASQFGYYSADDSKPGDGGNGGGIEFESGSIAVSNQPQAGGSTPLASGGAAGVNALYLTGASAGSVGSAAALNLTTRAGGGGGGGGGAGYTGMVASTPYAFAATNGANGGFPGGGGGGGGCQHNTRSLSGAYLANGTGGAGANGVIILIWK